MNTIHVVPLQRQYHIAHQAALARITAAGAQRIARKVEADLAAKRAAAAALLEADEHRQREWWEAVPAELTPKYVEIQKLVARHYKVTRASILSPKRTAKFVLPRQIAMFFVRECIPAMSLPDIGRHFGGRDHTTCLSGIQKITARIAADAAFAAEIDEIRAAIDGRGRP